MTARAAKPWAPEDSPDHNAALCVAALIGGVRGIPPEHLFRATRGGAKEAFVRLEFYWLLHTAAGLSLARVAFAAAGRDRTSVASGVKRIENELSKPGYAAVMERFSQLAREAVELGAALAAAEQEALRG